MVDYARDDEAHEPPPILLTALYCRKFNTLPRAGGLREQDAQQLRQMSNVLATYDAFTAYAQAEHRLEWRKRNRDRADWIDSVTEYLGAQAVDWIEHGDGQ